MCFKIKRFNEVQVYIDLFQVTSRFSSSIARKLNVAQNFLRDSVFWFDSIEWPHIIPKSRDIWGWGGDKMECLKWNEVIFMTISEHWNELKTQTLSIPETFGSECGHNDPHPCYRRGQGGWIKVLNNLRRT